MVDKVTDGPVSDVSPPPEHAELPKATIVSARSSRSEGSCRTEDLLK
jgi:hypothetical protein